jgi:hypothetical protein
MKTLKDLKLGDKLFYLCEEIFRFEEMTDEEIFRLDEFVSSSIKQALAEIMPEKRTKDELWCDYEYRLKQNSKEFFAE